LKLQVIRPANTDIRFALGDLEAILVGELWEAGTPLSVRELQVRTSRIKSAAVIFYGRSPSPIELVKNLQCPILGNYAGADMAITESDINLLKQTLTKYAKEFDITIYPSAPHAFFNDTKESYRPDAAKDAWERTLNFFNNQLKL
jgi:dienelactone hydrolase